MAKNILIFSNGTGQAGGLTPDEKRTNVYKLFRATRCGPDTSNDPDLQLAFYDPGLGSNGAPGGKPITLWRRVYNLVSQATGLGITRNIVDCYAAIISTWRPGDRIYLFGFSRGAYTARCVGGVLALCGVPRKLDGKDIPIDPANAQRIAEEAVKTVYQHGASKKAQRFRDQRAELAFQFRQKYASDNDGVSNAVPYFIGVWDTVAALGASWTKTIAVGALASMAALAVCAAAAWVASAFFSFALWPTALALLGALIGLAAISYLWTHLKWTARTSHSIWRTIHIVAWQLKFYDRNLNERVAYARHALSIDERREDFKRVEWTNAKGIASKGHAADWFEQIWFAGNHADLGGGYSENESRLSDISLQWMVDEVRRLPHPVIVDRSYLRLFPSTAGIQHDETRSAIGGLAFLRWRETIRDIPRGAYLHRSVFERRALGAVQIFDRFMPYDPPNLRDRSDFNRYDPKPAPSWDGEPHTPDGDDEQA